MINEPHENLDSDPFADDAQRRPSRLRRPVVPVARHAGRARCATVAGSVARTPLRHLRPCPHAARGPLR